MEQQAVAVRFEDLDGVTTKAGTPAIVVGSTFTPSLERSSGSVSASASERVLTQAFQASASVG